MSNNKTNYKKEFLGHKDIEWNKVLNVNSQPTVNSINSYLSSSNNKGETIISNDLFIQDFQVIGILQPSGLSVEIKDKESSTLYAPIDFYGQYRVPVNKKTKTSILRSVIDDSIVFTWGLTFGTNYSPFYISPLGRPNASFIIKKLEQILKREYPGTFHIKDGRYGFCFEELPIELIYTWMEASKNGSPHIDRTWIAAFQDLVEIYQDKEELRNTKKKGKVKVPVAKMVEEDDGFIGDDQPLVKPGKMDGGFSYTPSPLPTPCLMNSEEGSPMKIPSYINLINQLHARVVLDGVDSLSAIERDAYFSSKGVKTKPAPKERRSSFSSRRSKGGLLEAINKAPASTRGFWYTPGISSGSQAHINKNVDTIINTPTQAKQTTTD